MPPSHAMPRMPRMDYPDYAERTLSELNATIDVGSISRDFPRMSICVDPPPRHLAAQDDGLASPPPAWIWRRSQLAMAPADDAAPASMFDNSATSGDDEEDGDGDVRAAMAGAAAAATRAATSAAAGSRRGRKLCGTILRLFELRRMSAAAAPPALPPAATPARPPLLAGASPTPQVNRTAAVAADDEENAHDDGEAPPLPNPFATTAAGAARIGGPVISHNSPFGVHAGATGAAAGLDCTSPFRTSEALPFDPGCDTRRAHFAELQRVVEERAELLSALRLQAAAWGADADMSTGMRELMASAGWWHTGAATASSSSNVKVPCDGATPMLRFLWCFSQSVVFFASRRISSLFELPFAEHLSDVEWVVRVLTEPWLEHESRAAREARAAATAVAERGVFGDECDANAPPLRVPPRQPSSTTTSETELLRGGSGAGGPGYGTNVNINDSARNSSATPAHRDGSVVFPAALLAVSPVVGAAATNPHHTPASAGAPTSAASLSSGKIYICHEITSRNLVPADARSKIPQFYVSWVLQLTVDAGTGAAIAAEIVGTRVYRVRLPASARQGNLFKRIFSCCFSDEAAAEAAAEAAVMNAHAPRQQQHHNRSRTPAASGGAGGNDEAADRRRGRSVSPQPPTSTTGAAGAPPQPPLHPATYDGETTKAERNAMKAKYRKNVTALEACARDRFADAATPVPVFAVTAAHVPYIVLRQVRRDERHREFTQYHMHNSTL